MLLLKLELFTFTNLTEVTNDCKWDKSANYIESSEESSIQRNIQKAKWKKQFIFYYQVWPVLHKLLWYLYFYLFFMATNLQWRWK